MSPRGAPGQTRQDILDAARSLFGEVGYAGATIRAIARRAHVDPALVIQYFGSKDELLVTCLEMPVDIGALLADVEPSPEVGTELVRRALTVWQRPVVRHALRTLLRTGLSHERAADALRALISRSALPMIARLAGDDRAELRAALVGSHIAGLALGREVLGVDVLAQTSVEDLARAVGPSLTRYLTGDLG